MIEKGTRKDLAAIMEGIAQLIQTPEKHRINFWDETYPNPEVLENDMAQGTLYVFRDGAEIAGMIVLNHADGVNYDHVSWETKDQNYYVIHRFCVFPAYQKKGIGARMLAFAINKAQTAHYNIKLDTHSENDRSQALYISHGFQKRGTATGRRGVYALYEWVCAPD